MSSITIIFINLNAVLNRMLLCWAVSTEINWRVLIVNVVVDFVIAFSCSVVISGPLYIHTYKRRAPRALYNWLLGRADCVDKSLTDAEKVYGARKRDKWVYFSVLHGMCEIIMPLWYFYYYHLMSSSKIRDAFAGLTRDVHGAPIVRPNNLLTTCTILSCSEILDLMFFTFIVRRNFKSFNPFRILNRVVEKYNFTGIFCFVCCAVCTMHFHHRLSI